jgi:hypothetical protein
VVSKLVHGIYHIQNDWAVVTKYVAYRFDPSLDNEIRTFSRNLLKKASKSVEGRSEDGGVGQYANYASKLNAWSEKGRADADSGGC